MTNDYLVKHHLQTMHTYLLTKSYFTVTLFVIIRELNYYYFSKIIEKPVKILKIRYFKLDDVQNVIENMFQIDKNFI
jgi:hypothetical protein